ncbi:MAG: outer membrane beta-barrel protein [Mangrovibacterium sp.]
MKNSWWTDLKLSKNFLDGKFRFLLTAKNIFDSKVSSFNVVNNNMYMLTDRENFRTISLSVIYNFNARSSRYKGKSSSEELNRL